MATYNTERPHQAIGDRPPAERFSLRVIDEAEIVETEIEQTDEDLSPGSISRRVDKSGRIRIGGFSYTAGRYLAGEAVTVVFSGGLVEICHRGEIVATHARRHRPGAARVVAPEPRQRKARPSTNGPSVTRVVDNSGCVSFAGWSYRAGNPYRALSVCVAIVGRNVEISYDGAVIRTHPIRHDRQKEFGAFSTPNGRPRNQKAYRERPTG